MTKSATKAGARALAALAAGLAPLLASPAAADPGTPDAARRAEIVHLLRQDCGACHGMTLKGGLGPPLEPEALAGRPADDLAGVILHGRPGTPMPPWAFELSDDEAAWLARRLKEGLDDADEADDE